MGLPAESCLPVGTGQSQAPEHRLGGGRGPLCYSLPAASCVSLGEWLSLSEPTETADME